MQGPLQAPGRLDLGKEVWARGYWILGRDGDCVWFGWCAGLMRCVCLCGSVCVCARVHVKCISDTNID